MNFQDVRNAPEKQWVDGIGITIKSFGAEPNDRFGNFVQGVVGVDAANEEFAFKVVTQYEETLLVYSEIGQTMPFRLKWFNSRAGDQMQGYCTKPKKLRITPAAQPTPQPQAAQNAPQAPPPPKDDQPDWDLINLGKCRDGKYNAVIRAGCDPITLAKDRNLLLACEFLAHKSMHGIKMTDAEKFQMEQDLMVDDQGLPM